MPIIVSRKTGEVLSAPVLTQEQRDKLWEAIIRGHVRRHPEIFQEQPHAKEAESA